MRRSVLLLAAILFVALPLGADEDDAVQPRTFMVRDRRQAQLALKDMDRYLEAGRIASALREAQRVLDEMADDLYVAESRPASTRWRLAAEAVRERLARLDAAGRERYDRQSEAKAAPLMARARQEGDASFLEEVVRRFGASRHGRGATRALSGAQLEAGRPEDAVRWAREGLRFFPADPVLLAHRDAAETLRTPAARPPPFVKDGPAPEEPRWTTRIPFPYRTQDHEVTVGFIAEDRRNFWTYWDGFRPLEPVIEGNVAYVGNGRALYALDVFSGRRLWTFDADTAGDELDLIPASLEGQGRTSFTRVFAPRIAGDLVVGTVELDRPYVPEHIQYVEITTYRPRRAVVAVEKATGRVRWTGRLGDRSIVSPCVVAEDLVCAVTARFSGAYFEVGVVAFDRHTGALRWHRVLGVGQQEQNLFGAPVKEYATAAPTVEEGVLYATSGLGFLAAVDLRSGRERWLASHEIQPIRVVHRWFRAPLRFPSVAPSSPVVADGLVIAAPVDGKHLSAYDASTGALRWRVPYPRPRPRSGRTAHFLGVADDGRRRVALLAGTSLQAFDVRTGERAWEGRFQDGFGHLNATAGRGVVADGQVLVPTEMGLVRFDLAREGSYLGRRPWPHDVDGGNLLPLARTCLVAGRDRIAGFFSWERIAEEVEAKRRVRPDDPQVLLEAGKIFRAGRAFDRAVLAFEQARVVARKAEDRTADEDAREGLFRTFLAMKATERALAVARTSREKVQARLARDRLLEDDLPAKAKNLEALIQVASGVVADLPGYRDPVPVRAAALLQLADVQLELAEPEAAVRTLQQLLAEEGDQRLGERPARLDAKTRIDEIRNAWGAEVYAPYETEAKRELEAARKTGDTAHLEAILRRFPNASVVPESLLRVAEERFEDDRAAAARTALLRLLADHPTSVWAAPAAEVLVRVLENLGQDGGMRYAARWLEQRHGKKLAVDVDVESPPPHDPGKGRLKEVRFEKATGGSWGRELRPQTPPGIACPLALYQDGDRLLGFDLPEARLAFDLYPGSCSRAAFDDGIVVVALRGALQAFSADDGAEVWRLPLRGTTSELQTAHGHVFALMHETKEQSSVGDRSLVAVDLTSGDLLWRRALDQSEYRAMFVSETDVLLYQARYHQNRVWPAVLVYDGLTGHLQRMISLPPGRMQGVPVVAGRRVVYVSREHAGRGQAPRYRLTGADLDGEASSWTRPLPGQREATALLQEGDRVVVLQGDGYLSGVRASDGAPREQTRILVEDGTSRVDAYPFTRPRLEGETLLLMPRVRTASAFVGAWSTRTGKLLWERPLAGEEPPSRAQVELEPTAALALSAWSRRRATAQVVLRVLDRKTGAITDEVEPTGLGARDGVLTMAHGWGSVVVCGNDGVVMYATDR